MSAQLRGRFAVAVAVVLYQTAALAQSTLSDAELTAQLQRMANAMRQGNYQGALIYQHEGRLDSLRIFHAAGTPERERLLSLSGPNSEVVRSGGQLVCRLAGANSTLISFGAERSLLPLVPHLRSSDLSGSYKLVSVGEERVAGYQARVIDLQACDEFRYGYRLWLERDSGMLLRAALMGSNNQALEQMMFVNVEIGAAPRSEDLALAGQTATPAKQEAAEVAMNGPVRWRFVDLPPSFRVESRLTSPSGSDSEHLLLTDGVANVSVYVEPRADDVAVGVSVGGRGALSVYSRDMDALRVVVLGNVPVRTAQRIADALRPAAAAH
jgi:sigma-E factor negative regulatory protein RseB